MSFQFSRPLVGITGEALVQQTLRDRELEDALAAAGGGGPSILIRKSISQVDLAANTRVYVSYGTTLFTLGSPAIAVTDANTALQVTDAGLYLVTVNTWMGTDVTSTSGRMNIETRYGPTPATAGGTWIAGQTADLETTSNAHLSQSSIVQLAAGDKVWNVFHATQQTDLQSGTNTNFGLHRLG